MVSVKWCLKQRRGMDLIEPNRNMSGSYISMAQESVNILDGIKASQIWTATAAYYVFYYSLYSVMLRIGVKCEIHSCSLEFMKRCLGLFYSSKDNDMIEKAFEARINLQYYADRPVDDSAIEEAKRYCSSFFIKTKDILSNITEKQILQIRKGVEGLK